MDSKFFSVSFLKYITTCLVLVLFSCATPKNAAIAPAPEITKIAEHEVNLDTLEVSASDAEENEIIDSNEAPYRPAYKREIDLLHTKLELSFDMKKEEVIGTATLVLKPYFYDINRFRLDAQNFIIKSITLNNTELKYDYDNENLYVNLNKSYNSNEEISIVIKYIARPSEFPASSSAAITSEKGLFFIDPREEDPDKPTQIWSQGEAENNSRWFPTVDKPNERCTQETILTVDKKYQTLSNGLLVSSKENTDGTRTDYWKMDMPHAPYLFMIAVGEYSITNDKWKDVPLQYYVEPAFEKEAKQIFNHTPEILEFFSNTFGMKYPWPKLAQIVVRDYVSGAMENTTAIVYGEPVQRNTASLIKDPNDYIIAHEISHHWFGDYVTCESWSNLTLNEGFANYSEYLWFAHQFGKDEADMHRMEDLNGYLYSSKYRIHPLIDFHYKKATDMFDAHTYNKGGLVLHMLRNALGDDAFFASLKLYLQKNAFSPVEVNNLRLACEQVSGQDLNWFFDQWFMTPGHPMLKIKRNYDEANKQLNITIQQTQDQPKVPKIFNFTLPFYITTPDGERKEYSRFVDQRIQTFTFPVEQKPILVEIDPDRLILCERDEDFSDFAPANTYSLKSPAIYRYDAIEQILQKMDAGDSSLTPVMNKALEDPLWQIRSAAITKCDLNDPKTFSKILDLAKNDKSEDVRIAAIAGIAGTNSEVFLQMADHLMKSESNSELGRVLVLMQQFEPEKALTYAEKYDNTDDPEILAALVKIYSDAGKTDKLPILAKGLNTIKTYDLISYTGNYAVLLAKAEPLVAQKGFDDMYEQGIHSSSKIKRFASGVGFFQVIVNDIMLKNESELNPMNVDIGFLKDKLKDIIVKETDPELQSAYKRFRLD